MICVHTIAAVTVVGIAAFFGFVAGLGVPGRLYVDLFKPTSKSDRNEHGYPDCYPNNWRDL